MIITTSLSVNISILKDELKNCDDVIFRSFRSGDICEKECVLIFTDGICDKDMLSRTVLEKIMASDFLYPENTKKELNENSPDISVPVYDYKTENTYEQVISAVLSGNGALLVDGENHFINITATKMNSRSIQEAKSKGVIRGPRDGFTENFLDSTSLIRRRLKTKELKMEFITVGTTAPARIALCYLNGQADTDRVDMIREKLNNLNIPAIIDSGQIQNALSQNKNRIISDIQATERADDAVFALSEGKIVIVAENSPFVLIIPGLLLSMLTSSEDYYESQTKRNAVIFLRVFSSVITILLPAIYVGFVKFNPDFLPDKIIIMLTQSRKNVAFPPFLEML
ncbi:MAG: spore germination protein, partial [Anaerofustis stercorihominis]|nr:spore germination protein [Anaerofustis stercorihominis]